MRPPTLSIARDRSLAPLLGLVALLAAAAPADDAPAPAPAPAPMVLFDGKSLEGWAPADFYKPGKVKVEEGAIVMGVGEPMTGVTTTRKDLPRTDYEFTYEAKRVKGGDFFAAATFPVGKSHVTLVNGGWGGQLTGLSSLNGADASENETTSFIDYQEGKWYRFKVRVTDKVIRCWVDGEQVADVGIEGVEVGTRIETRDNYPLGFATYRTVGAVRNVEVRKLTGAEVAATKPPDDF